MCDNTSVIIHAFYIRLIENFPHKPALPLIKPMKRIQFHKKSD